MTTPQIRRAPSRRAGTSCRAFAAFAVVALVLAGTATPLLATAGPVPVVSALAQAAVSGPVIVVLEPGAEPVRTLRDSDVAANPSRTFSRAIRGFSANLTAAEVGRLARDPRVRSITADLPVQAQAQTLPTGVDRIEADRNATAAIRGDGGEVAASIAILDSGIDAANPDLAVAGGVDCIGNGGYADVNGHGTHVAGIAAARDNDIGTVGVAPGAALYAVRVLRSDLSGSYSTLICGLDWVLANAGSIDVVNMSVAGTGSDSACTAEPLHQAICNTVAAGVTVVVAAGNFGRDAATTVPAAFDEVITVSAFTDYNGAPGGDAGANCSASNASGDDRFAGYSNFGGDVDIVAPGTCIRSSAIGGGTAFRTGTSMASPHVAGAAALYRATNPGASPAAVRSFVLGQSVSQGSASGISGDQDGVAEPVLQVASSAPSPTPTSVATVPPPPAASTATPASRTIRGGAATSTPRPASTVSATSPPAPGATSTTAPTSSRTIRGGTATPAPAGSTPPPASVPTATPSSRSIRGTTSGASTGGTGRTVNDRATATVPPPAATAVPPTPTVPPPVPTATLAPPVSTATLAPPVPTATIPPLVATEIPTTEVPTTVPAPTEYAFSSVTDDVGDPSAALAADGDPSTAWYADAAVPDQSGTSDVSGETLAEGPALAFDLGAQVPVGEVRWLFAETGYADRFDVQMSLDGVTWQTVTTRENALAGEWQVAPVNGSTRFVRFLFQNPNGDPVLGGIAEVVIVAPPT